MNTRRRQRARLHPPRRPTDLYPDVFAVLPPMHDVRIPDEAGLERWRDRVGEPVLAMWRRLGWGRFGNGFLTLADPARLLPSLEHWLGGPSPIRTPIARTGLGDLIYVRDLRRYGAGFDFSYLDVRYRQTGILALTVDDLLARLADEDWLDDVLDKRLFDRAERRLGAPRPDEIYGFVPALAVGGAELAANLERVRADAHLDLLLQL